MTKKCHKTATKMQKIGQKSQLNDQKSQWKTLNMIQLDPPGQRHPEVHPKYLLSTQIWTRKNQKRAKTAKRSQKRWFCSSKFPPWKMFFSPFPSCWPVQEICSRPKNFDRGKSQKWSFTFQKVEKRAFLYAKIWSFEKNFNFFFARLLSPSKLVVLDPRTLIGD